MEIEVLEQKERSMKFILKNSTPALANALRRTIISDIPKMAIDSVVFNLGPSSLDGKEGDSKTPLFDEIIAHRLGLVPIPTDYSLFNFQDKCTCGGEGCPMCSVTYNLYKMGPCTVFSSDMVPLADDKLAPVDKLIPIVELGEGQSLFLQATAIMGTAKKHVKWQVANGVGYKYKPVVKIDAKVKYPEELVAACPKKVFAVENGSVVVKNEIDCSLCMTCREGEFKDEPIDVKGDETSFVFTFETDGSLTAQQVLDKAAELLSKEADDVAKTVAAF